MGTKFKLLAAALAITVPGQAMAQTSQPIFVRCDVPHTTEGDFDEISPTYVKIEEDRFYFLLKTRWTGPYSSQSGRCASDEQTRIFCSVSISSISYSNEWKSPVSGNSRRATFKIDRREGVAHSTRSNVPALEDHPNFDRSGPCTKLDRDPATVTAF